MTDQGRFHAWFALALVMLAGATLALSWWDWAYSDPLLAWWRGEPVYAYFWKRLGMMALVFEVALLGLWGLLVRLRPHGPQASIRAAALFLPALLSLFYLGRHTWHPFGLQPGSSAWVFGLATVTSVAVALPLSRLPHPSWAHAWLQRRGTLLACIFVGLYALAFGSLSVARHTFFRSHALDLGTMDQAAWNTVQGRILERTPLYRDPAAGSRYENRLLDAKLELAFIPLSALYWLWSDPRSLLIVQTLFLAAGAVPLYLLVYERTASSTKHKTGALPALLLSAAYLCYLPLHYVNMADFHPSALMVPLLVAAWRAQAGNRWRAYYMWLVLALLCRVDAAFAALALGAVIFARRRGHGRHGLYTAALAVAWLALDFAVVVPAIRQVYGPGAGDLVARRFGALGNDPWQALRTLLTQPAFALAQIADREKLQTVFDLLAPLGFTPLLAPVALSPALPVLFINLLAESSWQNTIYAHYMAPAIPFIWIAAGESLIWLTAQTGERVDRQQSPDVVGNGLATEASSGPCLSVQDENRTFRVSRRQPRTRWLLAHIQGPEWGTGLAIFVLLNTALVTFAFGPFYGGKAFHLSEFWQMSDYTKELQAMLSLVPTGASVCAQSDLHPHLSQRRDACLFPRCELEQGQPAEYLVLDLDPTSAKSPLDHHAYYQLVDLVLQQSPYGVIARRGGALLLQRSAPRDNIPAVLDALETYGQRFYRVEYLNPKLPVTLRPAQYYRVPITLRNAGSGCWSSWGQLPVRLTYRWWREGTVVSSGSLLRTDLPFRVDPGNQVRLRARLLTPPQVGEYILEWDMVREGDAWFSERGATPLRQVVTIQ
jgi:uncharacterized membrane protein